MAVLYTTTTMSVYVLAANPDVVTEGAAGTDHTLQIPWANAEGCFATVTVLGSGTIKFNTRGPASESDDSVAVNDERTFTVYGKQFSYNKSAGGGQFSISVVHY